MKVHLIDLEERFFNLLWDGDCNSVVISSVHEVKKGDIITFFCSTQPEENRTMTGSVNTRFVVGEDLDFIFISGKLRVWDNEQWTID